MSYQRCAGQLGGKADFAVSGRKKITDANIHLTGSLYLDIFRESMHNKGIIDKLDAWPTFLSMDSSEVIVELIERYPEFRAMYEHIYNICRNVEGMMEMYSEELKILDRNTVKYMVDQMQEQIDNQKEKIAAQEKEIQMLKRKLEEQK